MEKWTYIKGYEGLYSISNKGAVRSFDRLVKYADGKTVLHRGRLLKPQKRYSGHMCVVLVDRYKKKKTYQVHRLVAEAYLPNPGNKPQVNHIDGDKSNNNVSNLEWCTNYENAHHAIKNGLHSSPPKPIQSSNGKGIGMWFPSLVHAAKYGYKPSNIVHCLKGRRNKHHGLLWENTKSIT